MVPLCIFEKLVSAFEIHIIIMKVFVCTQFSLTHFVPQTRHSRFQEAAPSARKRETLALRTGTFINLFLAQELLPIYTTDSSVKGKHSVLQLWVKNGVTDRVYIKKTSFKFVYSLFLLFFVPS